MTSYIFSRELSATTSEDSQAVPSNRVMHLYADGADILVGLNVDTSDDDVVTLRNGQSISLQGGYKKVYFKTSSGSGTLQLVAEKNRRT